MREGRESNIVAHGIIETATTALSITRTVERHTTKQDQTAITTTKPLQEIAAVAATGSRLRSVALSNPATWHRPCLPFPIRDVQGRTESGWVGTV